ncbi:MAG: hypothetical protein QNJ17_04400 [Desulfocapsaceae bacterium]|nr:hypothetical protein [Desulfocapsaceae bacterium]
MLTDNQLLIVGGTTRNVGKTEFVCRLIEKISHDFSVYGLKVSAIFPDEGIYHGDHSDDMVTRQVVEETRLDTSKDTSRMLRAGAHRVFYLRSEDDGILSGYQEFRNKLPQDAIVVCESNALGEHLKAGLQIIVTKEDVPVKARAQARLQVADLVVISDGNSGFKELECIDFTPQKKWHIKKRG